MLDDDDVYIGSFMFCREHGCELCHECCTDHRYCNSMRISDKLSAVYPGLDVNEIKYHRPPISYVLKKAVETKESKPKERVYKCREHHTIDCSTCFDWEKQALYNMKRQADASNSKIVPVDITREEKLKLLHAMGIDTSSTTLLSEKAMERKFHGAIDASQSFDNLIEKAPFDPLSLPLWSKQTAGQTLLEFLKRKNVVEPFVPTKHHVQQSAFIDARQALMSLANGFDSGVFTAIIQDKSQSYGMCIKVIEIRTLGKTPVMMLMYSCGNRDTDISAIFPALQEVIFSQSRVVQISASPEAQKLLLTILNLNAQRLASNYSLQQSGIKPPFVLSFLLPITPVDVGMLGCGLCGKKATSRCSQCHSVQYCGTECQKLHWREHKPVCNSSKNEEWVDINFSMLSTELHFAATTPASNIRLDDNESIKNPPPIPSNIHGDGLFLIKMRKDMITREGSSITICDRQKSFQVYLHAGVDPNGYAKTVAQMIPSGRGSEIIRWARRTGESRLTVCIDKIPSDSPL